ncbi:MAG: flagellar basal body P-ring formation chaperone FlgA, partial [Enterobacteriaceae bacterium]
TSDVARMAKQENWGDYQIKVNVFIHTEANSFPPCKSALQASRPQGDKVDLARLRYDIRCEDGAGWETGVTVKPDVYLPVVVAKRTLQRGEKLAANDIELKKRNITSLHNGYITDPDDVMGLSVKKRIRDMQPISLSQLDQPMLVDRGQQVTILAGQDGIEIKTLGEAMKKGRKGDLIKVRNLSSGKVVTATVVDLGVVRVM